jgi:hypothetical protein
VSRLTRLWLGVAALVGMFLLNGLALVMLTYKATR